MVEILINLREENKNGVVINNVDFEKDDLSYEYGFTCSVYTKEQLEFCLAKGFKRIYVSDYSLYKEYELNNNIYYNIPRCSYKIDNYSKAMISDYLDFRNGNYVGNYSLNVMNIYTAYYLKQYGLNNIPISVELSNDEIKEFIDLYNEKFGNCEFEILVRGYVENMVIKGNILDIEKNEKNYKLVDFKGRNFFTYYDGDKTHIYNYEEKNIENDMFYGKCSLRFDFYGYESDKFMSTVNDIDNI